MGTWDRRTKQLATIALILVIAVLAVAACQDLAVDLPTDGQIGRGVRGGVGIRAITCNTYNSSDTPVSIVDETEVYSTISVSAPGQYIYGITTTMTISHTDVSELRVSVKVLSASKRAQFYEGDADPGTSSFTNVSFNNDASDRIVDASAPYDNTTYKPYIVYPSGLEADGDIILYVNDTKAGNTGEITSWQIELCTDAITPTPTPTATPTATPTTIPVSECGAWFEQSWYLAQTPPPCNDASTFATAVAGSAAAVGGDKIVINSNGTYPGDSETYVYCNFPARTSTLLSAHGWGYLESGLNAFNGNPSVSINWNGGEAGQVVYNSTPVLADPDCGNFYQRYAPYTTYYRPPGESGMTYFGMGANIPDYNSCGDTFSILQGFAQVHACGYGADSITVTPEPTYTASPTPTPTVTGTPPTATPTPTITPTPTATVTPTPFPTAGPESTPTPNAFIVEISASMDITPTVAATYLNWNLHSGVGVDDEFVEVYCPAPASLAGYTLYNDTGITYTYASDNLCTVLKVIWCDEMLNCYGDESPGIPASGTFTLTNAAGNIMDVRTFPTMVTPGNSWAADDYTDPGGSWSEYFPSPGTYWTPTPTP